MKDDLKLNNACYFHTKWTVCWILTIQVEMCKIEPLPVLNGRVSELKKQNSSVINHNNLLLAMKWSTQHGSAVWSAWVGFGDGWK